MAELLITLFSTVGSGGFGSILKIAASFLEKRHEVKIANEAAKNANVIEWQKAVFSEEGQSKSSAMTRRILATMIIGTLCAGFIICLYKAGQQFTTFLIPEMKQGAIILWGLIRFPSTKEVTVTLTMGHLALMFVNIGAMTAGFYFTPGGKR